MDVALVLPGSLLETQECKISGSTLLYQNMHFSKYTPSLSLRHFKFEMSGELL